MELLNFLNTNSDWEQLLAAAPYSLDIKHDGDYVLFSYNQFLSDMSLELVKEARGAIFRKENNRWICVCYPFRKFFNWQEGNADVIDWSKGVDVLEKIDGSLMKLWYDRGEWHLSTNGTIDANKCSCNGGEKTFNFIFVSILNSYFPIEEQRPKLDPHYTYFFELVAPNYNTIVVRYNESNIFYLGRRNMDSFEEDCDFSLNGFPTPRKFHFTNFLDCVEAAHKMGDDEEGYVVRSREKINGSFLRVKVKGDEYLRLHRLSNNRNITTKVLISYWKDEVLDDFYAGFPDFREQVNFILKTIKNLCEKSEIAFDSIKGFDDEREFAMRASQYIPPIRAYLFARKRNKVNSAYNFFKDSAIKLLTQYVEGEAKYGN